jgi:hypothetical protein
MLPKRPARWLAHVKPSPAGGPDAGSSTASRPMPRALGQCNDDRQQLMSRDRHMTMDVPGLSSKVRAKRGVLPISASSKRLPTSPRHPTRPNTLTRHGASQALRSSGD